MQLLYNDLFTERYKIMSQTLQNSVNDVSKSAASISQELKTAKRQSLYKELNFNVNLERVFDRMDANCLKNVKKMHMLYAAQKQREEKKTK